MGTIVQEYGPIYGEPVNGTVLGRPNGSVYVPLSNTIEISAGSGYVVYSGGYYKTANSNGNVKNNSLRIAAESQDLASYVVISFYSDSDCTIEVGTGIMQSAGVFNNARTTIAGDTENNLVDEATYYVRAQLVNNGTPIATSNVLELGAIVP